MLSYSTILTLNKFFQWTYKTGIIFRKFFIGVTQDADTKTILQKMFFLFGLLLSKLKKFSRQDTLASFQLKFVLARCVIQFKKKK